MRQKKGEVNSNNGVCRRDILNIENKLKYATGDKFFFISYMEIVTVLLLQFRESSKS